MRRKIKSVEYEARGFTLIELLVVVAIIALLISILLPSLSKARAQARTTLCASRIAQLAKAFLIYSDDYNETPPFIAPGRGRVPGDPNFDDKNPDLENWLAGPNELDIIWDQPEQDWPMTWVRTGWLYDYTRFEALYRCPEFERINSSLGTQFKFNYSRCSLGRKATADVDNISSGDGPQPYGIGFNGRIVKPSAAYASSQLPMVIDEDWFGYISYHGTMSFSWDETDPVMDIVDSYIGAYHGAEKRGVGYINGEWLPPNENGPWHMRKSGSVAMYDGHVELIRDWMPRGGDPGDRGGRQFPNPVNPDVFNAYMDMIGQFFYSQQGLTTQDIFAGG